MKDDERKLYSYVEYIKSRILVAKHDPLLFPTALPHGPVARSSVDSE